MSKKCGQETEVYSRVVGYHRPVKQWHAGKRSEFKDRKPYNAKKAGRDAMKKQACKPE